MTTGSPSTAPPRAKRAGGVLAVVLLTDATVTLTYTGAAVGTPA